MFHIISTPIPTFNIFYLIFSWASLGNSKNFRFFSRLLERLGPRTWKVYGDWQRISTIFSLVRDSESFSEKINCQSMCSVRWRIYTSMERFFFHRYQRLIRVFVQWELICPATIDRTECSCWIKSSSLWHFVHFLASCNLLQHK